MAEVPIILIMTAEYVAVDARFVHPLPEGLPSEVAAPLVCGKCPCGFLRFCDQRLDEPQ